MTGPPRGVPWYEFENAARDLAQAGRRLLQDDTGAPGVAFLGTVARDGHPRMHPFIPAIVNQRLWAFVIHSPKQRDLDRTGMYAVHSRLGDNDESFFAAGTAMRADDDQTRSTVGASMPYTDIDERHVLYEFNIERVLWTTWSTPTSPNYQSWRCQPTS
ncbi:MAG: hypothetical protein ABWZ15_01305 [Acidimicrobiia bacterium]